VAQLYYYPWPFSFDNTKYASELLMLDNERMKEAIGVALAAKASRSNNLEEEKRHGDVTGRPRTTHSVNDGSNNNNLTSSFSLDPVLSRHVFYLHVPKAGTSFFNTVYLHFCPNVLRVHPQLLQQNSALMGVEKKYGYDDEACYDSETNTKTVFYNQHRDPVFHWALDLDPSLPSTVVATFRDPYLRARSAFMYTAHHDLRPMKADDPNITFEEYVNLPQMKDCQVSMLTSNKECYALNKNNPNITKAKELIRQPNFFFGITERWDETICLFHKWFGGEAQPYELRNNRKTTTNSRHKKYHHMLDNVTREMMPEDLDTIFFKDAEKVFDERLKETGCYGWSSDET